MVPEDELKIRAQAESQALNDLLQLALSNWVRASGEVAVLKAKLAEKENPGE